MKKLITLLLLLFTLNSCRETPETKFERDGITLISPTGWKISDQEIIENQGYYLSIEKGGLHNSGLFAITWINYEIDLGLYIENYKDLMKKNVIYKNANLTFGSQIENNFNGFKTKSIDFKADLLGIKHEGIIHFFYEKNKTFSILIQEAIEDKNQNETGFRLIEHSLKIE